MPSTTANILRSSSSPLIEPLQITFTQKINRHKIRIDHSACPELATALSILENHEIVTQSPLNPSKGFISLMDITTVIKLFDNPPRPTSKQEKLQLQIAKTYLMGAVLRKLEKEVRFHPNEILPAPTLKSPPKSNRWNWLGLVVMTIIDYISPLIANLLLSGDWVGSLAPYLSLLPFHIMTPLIIVSAITMVGGMICLAGPQIIRWIGLKCSNKDLSLIINQKKQIDIANAIHFRLTTFNNLSFHPHQAYCHFSNQMSEQIISSPLEEKKQGYISKALTVAMVALTGIQSLSGAILFAAVALGTITGAFAIATASPIVLTAFVASHIYGVLALAVPLAISQTIVSYLLRISSSARLFDPFCDDRKTIISQRTSYIENRNLTKENLLQFSQHKAKVDPFDQVSTQKYHNKEVKHSNTRHISLPTAQTIEVETGIVLLDGSGTSNNITFRR